MKIFLVLALSSGAAQADDHCACKYPTGLPEAFWKGGAYEDLAAISQYGIQCAPWDSIPSTPWYADYCDTTAGKDYCTKADSWCDDAWCYVDKSCPTWTATSVFADVEGAPDDLGYSYQTCGALNCYTNSSAEGCPHDPLGVCDDPCACGYAQGGLPEAFWKGGQYENLSMISQYGATCAAWDSVPDTPWYSGSCDGVDYCHRNFSWCASPWCYVDKECTSWTATSVFADVAGAPGQLGYSYETCGAPNCYSDNKAAGCPYDHDGTCCQCKYATGLPEAFWTGGQYETLPMISVYGVKCAPWDSIPSTPWYADYCDTTAGKDYCTSADGWCNDPWCYVDKDTCNSWVSTSVFSDVAGAPETLGYSYLVCGSLDCYNTPDAPGCPYDPQEECAHSMDMTCGDLKDAYKENTCCGNPTKKVVM